MVLELGRAGPDCRTAGLPVGQQGLGLRESLGDAGQIEEGLEHLVEGLGVDREKLGRTGEFTEDQLDVMGPHGADVTERLGDDEVGRERPQAREVEREGGAAGRRLCANRLVDLLAGKGCVEQRAGDPGEGLDPRGKVAFMADRHQLVFQAQQAEHFGDTRHE
jgi:hypothetical protein